MIICLQNQAIVLRRSHLPWHVVVECPACWAERLGSEVTVTLTGGYGQGRGVPTDASQTVRIHSVPCKSQKFIQQRSCTVQQELLLSPRLKEKFSKGRSSQSHSGLSGARNLFAMLKERGLDEFLDFGKKIDKPCSCLCFLKIIIIF